MLEALLRQRDALVARVTAEGYEMTDADRTEMNDLAARIATASSDAQTLAEMRAVQAPAAQAAEVRDVSGTVTREDESREDADASAIDTRSNLTEWVGRNNSGPVTVRAALTSSNLFDDPVNGGARPEYLGIKGTVQSALSFLDIFPSRPTDASHIEYHREVPVTNAAAETAEGQLKPEQTFKLELVSHSFPVVAAWTTVTRQALRNVGELQALIEGRLTYNVRARINRQLWKGDGVGANIEGLRNSGITTFAAALGTDGEGIWKSIRRGVTVQAGEDDTDEATVVATHVVMHPADYEAAETYAIQARLGNPNGTLHGLTVITSPAQPQGSAVLGALTNPTVLEVLTRDGMEVVVSREHSDNLTKNLSTVLAEQEAGLAVYKPADIVEVQFTAAA